MTLELGGKNALIAFPDADPADVAAAAVRGMNFTWCGQSCGSTSRAFLHESIYDRVLDKIIAAVSAIKPGLPTDDATEMGCLVSKAQFDKVMGYIAAGQADGAKLVAGGKKPDDPKLANGFYIEPAIFAGVTPQMRIAREEIFGPVLSVFKWRDENEMFEAVNAVDYGLTASIWTKDLKTAHRAAAASRSASSGSIRSARTSSARRSAATSSLEWGARNPQTSCSNTRRSKTSTLHYSRRAFAKSDGFLDLSKRRHE